MQSLLETEGITNDTGVDFEISTYFCVSFNILVFHVGLYIWAQQNCCPLLTHYVNSNVVEINLLFEIVC